MIDVKKKDKLLQLFTDMAEKYHDSEESVIWEMSCQIKKDREELEEEVKKAIEEFKSMLDSPFLEVRGEWLNEGHMFLRKCSVCQEIVMLSTHRNFCPNCGADMRKVEFVLPMDQIKKFLEDEIERRGLKK